MCMLMRQNVNSDVSKESPIQPHNEILGTLHTRQDVSQGVSLSLRSSCISLWLGIWLTSWLEGHFATPTPSNLDLNMSLYSDISCLQTVTSHFF